MHPTLQEAKNGLVRQILLKGYGPFKSQQKYSNIIPIM